MTKKIWDVSVRSEAVPDRTTVRCRLWQSRQADFQRQMYLPLFLPRGSSANTLKGYGAALRRARQYWVERVGQLVGSDGAASKENNSWVNCPPAGFYVDCSGLPCHASACPFCYARNAGSYLYRFLSKWEAGKCDPRNWERRVWHWRARSRVDGTSAQSVWDRVTKLRSRLGQAVARPRWPIDYGMSRWVLLRGPASDAWVIQGEMWFATTGSWRPWKLDGETVTLWKASGPTEEQKAGLFEALRYPSSWRRASAEHFLRIHQFHRGRRMWSLHGSLRGNVRS